MYNQDESTSKRISFQSIFSSLCLLYSTTPTDESSIADLEKTAHDINTRLHKKYPCEEIKQTPMQETKPKPRQCPKCKQFTLYHNKGISKAGNPYENDKCKCGYIKWATDNYYTAEAKAKAMKEDSILEEAQQQGYDESIPSEYQ